MVDVTQQFFRKRAIIDYKLNIDTVVLPINGPSFRELYPSPPSVSKKKTKMNSIRLHVQTSPGTRAELVIAVLCIWGQHCLG